MKNKKQIHFSVVFTLFGMLLSTCGEDIDSNMSEHMEDFSFITQDEETVDKDNLKSEWWVTYLSYTDCRTVCPRTTANMVDVQSKLKADGLQPQIISFNVDPEYEVDLDSWDFLTGYDFDTLQNIS